MNNAVVLAAIVLGAACSHNTAAPSSAVPDQSTKFTRGAAMFTVEDFATNAGILWARPSVTAGPSTITVQSTRYGSLCRTSVDGSATVIGTNVTLDVTFGDRPTSEACTTDIRALRYTAAITAAPGSYDVTVVHHENGEADTLVAQRAIVVP